MLTLAAIPSPVAALEYGVRPDSPAESLIAGTCMAFWGSGSAAVAELSAIAVGARTLNAQLADALEDQAVVCIGLAVDFATAMAVVRGPVAPDQIAQVVDDIHDAWWASPACAQSFIGGVKIAADALEPVAPILAAALEDATADAVAAAIRFALGLTRPH